MWGGPPTVHSRRPALGARSATNEKHRTEEIRTEGPALRRIATTDLLALAKPEMKLVGRFTCGACKMYCSIDRFEVSGRKFPFGGRCSLYENVWKRKSRTTAARDLVEQRSELLFGRRTTADSHGPRHRVGIPKALTTHSLFPLYSTFFSALGMDVVRVQRT